MGSSVIFLVVIAIWAAFLLPDLQIRRHRLAESRAAARVLGASRTLARAGRKRDDDAAGAVAREDVADAPARVSGAIHAPAAKAAESEKPTVTTGAQAPVEAPAPRRRSRRGGGGRALAWVLASLLLAALISVPTTIVLAALTLIPWWSVGVAVGAVVVVLGLMRVRVAMRKRVRRAERAAASTAATPAPAGLPVKSGWKAGTTFGLRGREKSDAPEKSSGTAASKPAPKAPVAEAETDAPAADPASKTVMTPAAPRVEAGFFDQEDEVRAAAAAAAQMPLGPTSPPTVAMPVIDDRPGRWTPQQLPRPTYLLKPKAPEGPLVAPTLGSAPADDPFLDLLNGESDDDLPQARAV